MARPQRTVIPLRQPPRRRGGQAPRRQGPKGGGGSWGKALVDMRPALLLVALATALAMWNSPATVTPYDPANPDARLMGRFVGGEVVDASFGLCDDGYTRNCVTDGDTIRIGERHIRIVGIDTAEKDARCPAEAEQAHASTLALQQWLNQGHFMMTPQAGDPVDGYGRELQVLARFDQAGEVERLAEWMQDHGGARSFGGGQRRRWC